MVDSIEIEKAYKRYYESHWIPPKDPNSKLISDQLWGLTPQYHNKESFIIEYLSNPEFRLKWKDEKNQG